MHPKVRLIKYTWDTLIVGDLDKTLEIVTIKKEQRQFVGILSRLYQAELA